MATVLLRPPSSRGRSQHVATLRFSSLKRATAASYIGQYSCRSTQNAPRALSSASSILTFACSRARSALEGSGEGMAVTGVEDPEVADASDGFFDANARRPVWCKSVASNCDGKTAAEDLSCAFSSKDRAEVVR